MAEYGLTLTGFVPKPLEVLRDEINAALRGEFGASLDLSDSTPLGQLVGIVAERLAMLWELAEKVNAGQDPDAATGTQLRALAALTGTEAEQARPSTVTLTLTGAPGTNIPTGSRVATASTQVEFETVDDATIAAAPLRQASTAYALDARVTNSSRIYVCTSAGTSSAGAGPLATGYVIDGTVTWRYLGEGTGYADAEAESVDNGALVALSGDITTIATPLGGWQSVVNILDADLGQADETDEALRIRRDLELSASGAGTPEALRADLLQVDGVEAVTVFYNDTDTTDAEGVPPHSVEALVRGGENADIFAILKENVAAGTGIHGDIVESFFLLVGQPAPRHTAFSRPTDVNIYVVINVTRDIDFVGVDIGPLIAAKIVEYGDAQATGKNAVASAISAQAFKVDGVIDVTACFIGTAPAPATSATIAISSRQLAVFDTSRITVNVTNGVP